LVLDMLAHVLSILHSCERFERISVVSSDWRALSFAEQRGAMPVLEQQRGHNPALRAAAQRELDDGAQALLTISADLPLLDRCDILSMIALAEQFDVVLAPSHEGTGTNALLTKPPLVIPYLFGENSSARHLEAARTRHINSTLYQSSTLAFDVDTIEDVQQLERVRPMWREQPGLAV
ncbi:MAG TPA: 2-phospho-L-lactate guanylyltransferase, partial [Ktedonobacteraceae bacterium]|nr:2-phospho-L-lactate guanylyltransferase [Ktedonobacteraceae bacterium]